ncbi:DEAD/DEAH box helicase family protein [Clostridium estertheticum]|uniref:NgoFVII family restriction endonuclease n=2 Tax=Clostridium estertheticum TaxID=238834 RepID=A0A1J0GF85_9CLOT|nr:DEAD/DEAH box helicase family protein [Clostridium estertheticum]APC39963.1 NgoFVII family restriction endonuclease [Clostridium estertheticum subsp. estertheticum]MBZ9613963.1 DEAD/DEAH box helicase family protein [Clostridium estertheticum subsp. laramiense]WAG73921.1 DEAD/DEAH box helicase family protein [Clostridium estertheticum]
MLDKVDIVTKDIITSDSIQFKGAMLDYDSNCSTGDKDYLLPKLAASLRKAKTIDMAVGFLMESGVKLLINDLKLVAQSGVRIRILTGNYLNITQPQALYLVKEALGDKVDLRFYNIKNKSFHPKSYIFEYEGDGDVFIGSSNMSNSALTSGIEWNYRINKNKNLEDFTYFKNVFEDLFLNHSIIIDDAELRRYSSVWKRPKIFNTLEEVEDNKEEYGLVIPLYEPRGAQIEALYELRKCREDGLDKGLVVAATGIGKTYLAAFDSLDFNTILFVAHREEILNQAEVSFKNIRPNIKTGFFNGGNKDSNKEVLFATVQTLGQKQYLCDEYFKKDAFDYIIIDEFHHAAAGNYSNILEYFTPKFLLGLTATPERLDNKDVFALCDYNIVYEVRLKGAIDKGWLVPFRYYGVFDETDYTKISFKNGKYDETELEKALMINKRSNLILKHYEKYNSKRALGFCSSRRHALYMSKYFNENGIKACAVISGEQNEFSMERRVAVDKLKTGKLNIIFSVDMFNEGLDIPQIDIILLLRPTESPTIFLQQLGRGLRKYKDKKYVNVLDFIGNYKKANLIPFFLSGNLKDTAGKAKLGRLPKEEEYPDDCIVDFDFQVIDIFKKMMIEQKNIFDLVVEDFNRIKEDLKTRPSRFQMYTYMDDDLYNVIRSRGELNIFNDYLGFLNKINEVSEGEKMLLNTKAYGFLNTIEKTTMTKTYKMPLLLAFYNDGNIDLKIDEETIFKSFREFYDKPSNSVDLLRHKSTKEYKDFEKKDYLRIAENPIKAFLNSAEDFFYRDESYFCLNDELGQFIKNPEFITHFKDIIDYRTRRFYKERLEKLEK